uniref:Uncharacterized protein n=1 Tax=Plectus sambesii TaxID=2011161 RepID=A0A914WIW1_9BILA
MKTIASSGRGKSASIGHSSYDVVDNWPTHRRSSDLDRPPLYLRSQRPPAPGGPVFVTLRRTGRAIRLATDGRVASELSIGHGPCARRPASNATTRWPWDFRCFYNNCF